MQWSTTVPVIVFPLFNTLLGLNKKKAAAYPYAISTSDIYRAHIAGRLNSGFDREIGALPPPHI
jgi:hypothetical protein